jgi:hypothetical protein
MTQGALVNKNCTVQFYLISGPDVRKLQGEISPSELHKIREYVAK